MKEFGVVKRNVKEYAKLENQKILTPIQYSKPVLHEKRKGLNICVPVKDYAYFTSFFLNQPLIKPELVVRSEHVYSV